MSRSTAGRGVVTSVRDQADVPYFTYAMMALSAIAYLGQMLTNTSAYPLDARGLLFGPAVQDGEWWRILTSGFMHGSIMHIAFNMYFIYAFGPTLETGLGRFRTALIYFGALFGGSAAVLAFNWDKPTLGASGAALGMAGGLAMVLWLRGRNVAQTGLLATMGLNLALPLMIGGISFWGHLGGIVGGAIVGGALVVGESKMKLSREAALVIAAVSVVALGAAAIAIGVAGGV